MEYICLKCGEKFKSGRERTTHLQVIHGLSSKEYYDIYLREENEGTCYLCGNITEFVGIVPGYRKYCCRKCADTDPRKQQLAKDTNIKRFGVSSVLKLSRVHDKGIAKARSEEINKKRDNTNLLKYGSTNPFGSTEIIKKISNTKAGNGSRSKLECDFEQELKNKGILYDYEYFDKRYPFHCDFYLIESDTFIEINKWWFHNTHFFDPQSPEDLKILALWEEKAKVYEQYRQAIYTWTVKDLNKKSYAEKNKLNYVVLWNKKDIGEFLMKL